MSVAMMLRFLCCNADKETYKIFDFDAEKDDVEADQLG